MSNFAEARAAMVNGQVRVNDVTHGPLLDAMDAIAREGYAPKGRGAEVYADAHVPLGEGRWMLRPREFAKLVQALDIKPTDLVLDVACGRGYSTAVLARLAETVIALEDDHARVEYATKLLGEDGADNTAVVAGDLLDGGASHGPYDVIFVNGAVEDVPGSWLEQLKDGGRLGVFVRSQGGSAARVFTRTRDAIGERAVFDATAPVLPGFTTPAAFAF